MKCEINYCRTYEETSKRLIDGRDTTTAIGQEKYTTQEVGLVVLVLLVVILFKGLLVNRFKNYWRGPREMTAGQRGIATSRYKVYALLSILIGPLLQTHGVYGEFSFQFFTIPRSTRPSLFGEILILLGNEGICVFV